MKTQEKNFDGIKLSGFTAILIMLALTGTAIYLLSLPQTPSIIAGVICGICVVVMLPGFMIIQPNNSRVLTFFGRYAGTVISNGFYWVNPLFLKSTVTLRILNLNIDPIKVNDKVGNPIMIGASLSAINAENQQIIKQTPNFTPKNVKLGVFILFKTNHIRSENNLIKNRTNEKNNQFIFRKISYLCSK